MARYAIHYIQTIVEDVESEEEAMDDICENLGFYIHLEKLEDDDAEDFNDEEE